MKKALFFLGVFVGLAGAFAAGFWFYAQQYHMSPGPLAAEKTVIIEPGTGFKDIVRALAAEGVIDRPFVFSMLSIAKGVQYQLKAGEYNFAAHVSPQAIMEKLLRGEVVIHTLTLPEGMLVEDMLALVAADRTLKGPMPQKIKQCDLLPETYHFTYGMTRAGLVAQMRAKQREILEALWSTRQEGLPLQTMREAVILASIVEKETGRAEERGRVAAVYINRLRQKMRLQADPTIIYGIYRATGERKKALSRKDLTTKTPYNTYIIAGLPPEPIACPGKDAIAAALNPPQTHDLYFVADGEGGHRFAATLQEHNRNVVHYRRTLSKK